MLYFERFWCFTLLSDRRVKQAAKGTATLEHRNTDVVQMGILVPKKGCKAPKTFKILHVPEMDICFLDLPSFKWVKYVLLSAI